MERKDQNHDYQDERKPFVVNQQGERAFVSPVERVKSSLGLIINEPEQANLQRLLLAGIESHIGAGENGNQGHRHHQRGQKADDDRSRHRGEDLPEHLQVAAKEHHRHKDTDGGKHRCGNGDNHLLGA
ncbi:hypothetical protein DSECCO2_526060 [anaerobic digester metagenome]